MLNLMKNIFCTKHLSRYLTLAFLALVLGLTSCKKDPEVPPADTTVDQSNDPGDDDPEPREMGTLEGTILSINGQSAVKGAKVFVDDAGEIYLTLSDGQGHFMLEAPAGQHELHIQTGHGDLFRTTTVVDVEADAVTEVPSTLSRLQQAASLAYIPGAYDAIEEIIIDTLGYSATQIQVADLDNLTSLQDYGAIFLNCGQGDVLDSTKYSNLLAYVLGGGSLYASDWAVSYLTGDGNFRYAGPHGGIYTPVHSHEASDDLGNARVTACSPEIGGFIADSELCSEKTGSAGLLQGVNVVAADLQAIIGNNMDVEYDAGAWEVIDQLGTDFEVLVEDNVPNRYGPLAIRLDINASNTGSLDSLLISTVNNGGNNGGNSGNGWVTICHYPPGNPANVQTITISTNALPAHLAHGDQVGPCNGSLGSRIYYTTFHNHPNAGIGQDMKQILEYFVLNL